MTTRNDGGDRRSRWSDWISRHGRERHVEPTLSVEVIEEGRHVRVRLEGELDMSTAGVFASTLNAVEFGRPAVLVIDLRGLTFMDSSGIRELFRARRRASGVGRRLVLVKGPGPIERVLEIIRADARIETVDDPSDVD